MAKKLMGYLFKTKVGERDAHEACSICMIDFLENSDIIILPCDSKHYFHEECIKIWLEKNMKCPLCNTAITSEMLSNQRRDTFNRASIGNR